MLKKRIAVLFFALLFLVAFLPSSSFAKVSNPIATAAGDLILPLRDSNMPFFSGGKLYVPVSLFTERFGLSVTSNKSENTFTVYNFDVTVVYDTESGMAYDSKQDVSIEKIISRNSQTYVGAKFIAEQFGFRYSYNSTVPYVRIYSRYNLDESSFERQNLSDLSAMLDTYKNAVSDPEPVPDGNNNSGQQTKPPPAVVVPEPAVKYTYTVYLIFDGAPSSGTRSILQTLNSKRIRGSFFLHGDILSADSIARQILVDGHSLGVSAAGGLPVDSDAADVLLASVNEQLLVTVFSKSPMVLASPDAALKSNLQAIGYRFYGYGYDGKGRTASKIAASFPLRNAVISLRLGTDSATAKMLPELIEYLQKHNTTFRIYSA